jgi:HK97 family phage prohead protease
MPYYITNTSTSCSGWATIKEDGEVIGCHGTKQDAIDQMVAVSLAEDMEPGGERAMPGELSEGDFVSWNSSGGRARGRIEYIMTEGTLGIPDTDLSINATEDDPAALIRIYRQGEDGWEPTEVFVGHKFSTLTKIDPLDDDDRSATRQVDLTPPDYMVAAARRGLRLYADGEAGDGLQAATVREARAMVRGEVSEDKWRRIGPWIARHLTDLQAVDEEGEITPGLVAHLLWGSGPTRSAALRAQRYAEDIVRRLNEEQDENRSLEDGMYQWSPRQRYLYDELEGIAETFGKFTKGIDSEGAHYVEESPFASDGLICANCAFYEGPRACEIVEGDIAPEAVCKFWIIPNELVREETPVPLYRSKDIQVQIRKKEPVVEQAQVETRRLVVQDFEFREAPNGGMTFRGYAAVFNSDSEPLPFIERIAPGAFDKTLRSRNNVKMYLNHDSTLVLASTRAKTLRLTVDGKGLLSDADLPNTSYARDLAELIKRGDVDSMSFGFSVPRGGDRWNDEGTQRELREVRLHEVSVVTGFPAYKATTASLRSIDALAQATGMNADKLAEALTMLENGKELNDDYAQMLSETIDKLRVAPVMSDKTQALALKQKHLELLLKQF